MADPIVDRVKSSLGSMALNIENPRLHRIYATVPREQIVAATTALHKEFDTRYICVIGARDIGDNIELVYPFALEKEERLIVLKTLVPKSDPNIDTISKVIPGAVLYEREAFEMLGVNFRDHPQMEILFLPETWGDKGNPLRKDWTDPRKAEGGEQ
ncbi:MAG: NADH-quinone oxidoreductase subunit C [Thermoplasmata archaeon]|nr:NADH-quinone oxidoreductase subunit C [Thermoplasmata archaeon]